VAEEVSAEREVGEVVGLVTSTADRMISIDTRTISIPDENLRAALVDRHTDSMDHRGMHR